MTQQLPVKPQMKLLFEKSVEGRGTDYLPELDVPAYEFSDENQREADLRLPEMSEVQVMRHYSDLADNVHGINNGIYLLGSCTMKHNPKINDEMANLPGFTQIHPLQRYETVQGTIEQLCDMDRMLSEVTGMDHMLFQPSNGAQGEFAAMLTAKKYQADIGEGQRDKIIIPDAAHGTNPATASMLNYDVITIPTNENGGVDTDALKAAVGEDTAALMLTNPNTIGIFDENILEITEIVHEAGGLCYYDGANLNGVMGHCRPGDMGFDLVHLNLHKTFSTPHGGGGPGSGAIGCKDFLYEYLPGPIQKETEDGYTMYTPEKSVGRVRANHGNYLVNVRAHSYLLNLGGDGLRDAATNAVLNANYMKAQLRDTYEVAYDVGPCGHEFILTLEKEARNDGFNAGDIAKGMLDYGMHAPTTYFPLNVEEALLVEPTETEPVEELDRTCEVLIEIYNKAKEDPEYLKEAPYTTYVRRPDETEAARNPILTYQFPEGE